MLAIYCRVSTDEQAKFGESIQDQQQALMRWAKERSYAYEIYADEGYSAHKSFKSRPALMRLLADVEASKVNMVIFTKFDRWTRRAADYYEMQKILDKHNVPWKAILEDYETVTADGRFKVGIMLSVNQHEAERTSDRLKFTFAEKRKRGEICSGNMPRGYKHENGKVLKDEDADGVNAFWRAYLAHGMKAGIAAAAEYGVYLKPSSVSYMLRTAYNFAGSVQGVECEPYISKEEAEYILKGRVSRPRSTQRVYLFSGLLYCAECGKRFGGHTQRYTHNDGEELECLFYSCAWRHRDYHNQCPNKTSLNESVVERYLLDSIAETIHDTRITITENAAKAKNTEQKRKNLEAKRKRGFEAYLNGIIDINEFKQSREKIDEALAELEEAEIKKPPAELPQGWRETYDLLSKESKRMFWVSIIDKIIVGTDRSLTVIPK